jgi:hypothetical protein
MHDMKIYTGSSVIIKLGAIWKELVSSPDRITPGYPLSRRVNGHLNRSINFRGKTNLFPMAGFDPRIFQYIV